jgi:molybdenum cofactor cytidylyltransferase
MNTSIENVYAIILAAGASRRMGNPKQLLEWQNLSLLEHAIQNARSLLHDRVIVVLGAHAKSIQTAVDFEAVTVIVNPDWLEGIASSLRAGIQALPSSTASALILVCDQPLISPAHIQAILSGWQNEPARMVASQYNDSIGVPALFPAAFFRLLLELKGDHGAKRLLLEFDDSVLKIPFPEAELDIDTMDDFNHLTRHYYAEE